jgi:type IV secretory pathway VirB4 component
VGSAGQCDFRREARGTVAHVAQEERGGGAGDPELSEIANSPYRDVILESCPTKLYLPNAEARNPQTRELYRKFGLSDRQIDIIAEAAPKRDYCYHSSLGRRLFQFALGPAALAFIGAGSKEDVLAARLMIAEFGERWPAEWLRARGFGEWSTSLIDNSYRKSH